MRYLLHALTLGSMIALLAGCGNLQRQSRSFDTLGTGGITIDASQRAVYSVTKKYANNLEWKAVCAEPSPDALSVLASSFGLDASVAGKALGIAINNQESAASIGLRTQTIQILRDGMYRLCEGYASGALDRSGFTRLQRRYQHVMLSLLAIEQITGPMVAQQIALTGSSGATLGKSLGEISKVLAEGATTLAAAEQDLSDSKDEKVKRVKEFEDGKKDGSTQALQDDRQKKVDTADKAIKEKTVKLNAAKTGYETLEAKLKEAQQMAVQASSSAASFVPAGVLAGGNRSNIAAVSSDIKDIVKALIDHDYTKDICMDVLLSGDSDEISAATFAVVAPMCAWAFKMPIDVAKSFQNSADERVRAVRNKAIKPPTDPATQPSEKK